MMNLDSAPNLAARLAGWQSGRSNRIELKPGIVDKIFDRIIK